MNPIIELNSNSWYKDNNIYVTGFIIDKSGIFTKEGLCNRVVDFVNNPNQSISGEFSCIIVEENQIIFLSDIIRSKPLFYTTKGNRLHISDECYSIKSKQNYDLDKQAVKTFLHSGFTHNNLTLNSNILQVEAGTIVTLQNSKKEIFDYSRLQDVVLQHAKPEDLLAVLSEVFDDYIKILNGKRVAISLSGGYDSRLVLAMLHLKKYDNISCFSHGRPTLSELKNAEFITQKLGINWHYINYDNIFDSNILTNDDFHNYCRYVSNDASMFFLKQFFPASYLERKKIIHSNAIIIAGHTGDVLSGGHLKTFMNTSSFTQDSFVNHLINNHYIFYSNQKHLLKILSSSLPEYDSIIPWLKYESWERKNRQAKFIVNSNRAYNYFGYETLIPLWDNRLVIFFKKLPFEQKSNCQLYRHTLKKFVFKPLGINSLQETNPSSTQLGMQRIKEQIKKILPKTVMNQFIKYADPYFYKEAIDLMALSGFDFIMPRQKNIWNAYLPQWYMHKEFNQSHSDIKGIIEN